MCLDCRVASDGIGHGPSGHNYVIGRSVRKVIKRGQPNITYAAEAGWAENGIVPMIELEAIRQ